jgi:hypothetical protein
MMDNRLNERKGLGDVGESVVNVDMNSVRLIELCHKTGVV